MHVELLRQLMLALSNPLDSAPETVVVDALFRWSWHSAGRAPRTGPGPSAGRARSLAKLLEHSGVKKMSTRFLNDVLIKAVEVQRSQECRRVVHNAIRFVA